jgi:hypothetical protein
MSIPSSNSVDLNQLISSLSVTRTNRARVREQGGQEEERSNADGTSFRSHISVGTEQPDPVNSVHGPPSSIDVEVQEQSSFSLGMGKNKLKYKLVLVPSGSAEFSIICGKAIGQGHSVCIVSNCSVNHQGDGTSSMLKGELRVLKNPTSVFAEPKIQSDILAPSLLHDWLEEQVTLDSWAERFRLANATMRTTGGQQDPNPPPQERVSAAILEAETEFAAQAAAFRTPRKRKTRETEELVPVDDSPALYKRQAWEHDFLELNPDEKIEKLIELALTLDVGLNLHSEQLSSVITNTKESNAFFSRAAGAIESRTDTLCGFLGDRPDQMAQHYEASSVWGTIAALATQLDKVTELTKTEKLDQMLKMLVKPIDMKMESLFKNHADSVFNDVGSVRLAIGHLVSEFQLSSEAESKRIDQVAAEVKVLSDNTTTSGVTRETSGNTRDQEQDTSLLEGFSERLGTFEGRLNKLASASDATSIQFGSLGYRTSAEANAFLARECPGHAFGLLVDPHAVMEHIWETISGTDVLKRMEKLVKIKLTTVSEGIAISSFEAPIPKFFSAPGHRVIKMNESYWSRITCWADWEEPNTGCKITLSDALSQFRAAHQQAIDIQLEPGSTFHNLCTLSLTDSVAFIEAFLTHVENWQREMMLSKFGAAKAFHVNTRVANRFWEDLYKPRAGVSRMLQTGNPQQIAQVTFWATLKSLDVMSRIRKYNFKDDPVVSSELVKFLTVNTGFEVVEQLSVKMKTLEESNKELSIKANSNVKTATNAAAKVAELTKAMTTLEKRVKDLEKK